MPLKAAFLALLRSRLLIHLLLDRWLSKSLVFISDGGGKTLEFSPGMLRAFTLKF
jgi:hypothetical protein